MAGNPKFLIGEINGVELEYRSEYVPEALDVQFNSTTSGQTTGTIQSAIEEVRRVTVNQPSHGFTLPSYGVLPVYYDNISGDYVLADSSNIDTAADTVITEIVDADNFKVQEGGYVFGTHGLPPGEWHVLDSTAGQIVSLDDYSDENVQYVFFTLTADILVIRMDPIYVRQVITPPITVLDNWVQQTASITVSAGDSRALFIAVAWEDSTTNGIASLTVGGVAATLAAEQTITSGFSAGSHLFYILEADIGSIVGTGVSITWNSGTPLDFSTAFSSVAGIDQTIPVVETNTDSGTGGTDTLNADVETVNEGYAVIVSSGGNAGMGFSNQGVGWTRQIDFTIASADGIVDDKFITADDPAENVEMDITGSNRHVLLAASFRKAT